MNVVSLSPTSTTVILVNFCGGRETLACLRALHSMPDKPGRVIVVDNGSADDSVSTIRSWLDTTDLPHALLPLIENNGYAAGNNAGIRQALRDPECQALWILNNDTEPRPGALDALCRCLNRSPAAGMAGSTLVYAHAPQRVQCAGGFSLNKLLGTTTALYGEDLLHTTVARDAQAAARQLDYICGASLLVRRDVLETLGPLAEDYFLYYEDTEFGLRARARGYALAWAPDSVVVHKEGGASGAATGGYGRASACPERVDYLSLRNRMYLMRTWFPLSVPCVIASYLGVMLNRIRRGQARRIPLICKALWHGLSKQVGKIP